MKSIKVAAAIVRRGDTILSTQRGYGEFKGSWEFPGGKVEPGETSEQALSREIREELDAEVTIERLVCHVSYDYPDFHLEMDCFLCILADDSLTLLEHTAAAWLDAASLRTVAWLPADVEVLEALEAQKIV